MSYQYYSSHPDIEVTRREIYVSMIGLCIAIIIGFSIATAIQNHQDESNKKYHQAIQLADSTKFNYAFKTDAGHTLSYGTVSAIGSVSDRNVGPYMSIHRVHERYTKHYRTVCSGEGKDRHCHQEAYWTWDFQGSKDWCVGQLRFLGRTFRFSEFAALPKERYVTTDNYAYHNRYVYYARPLQYTGTLYANIVGHGLYNPEFKDNVGLDTAVDEFSSKYGVVIFWIVFAIVVGIVIIIFVVAENKWLNGTKENKSEDWLL